MNYIIFKICVPWKPLSDLLSFFQLSKLLVNYCKFAKNYQSVRSQNMNSKDDIQLNRRLKVLLLIMHLFAIVFTLDALSKSINLQ